MSTQMRQCLKAEKQTGRVRYDLTPPVSFNMRRRIALQKMSNQHPRHVSEDYANNKGNPLLNFFLNQFMSPSLQTLIESRSLLTLYTEYQPQIETRHDNN